MSITDVEFFPSPRTLSDADYAEISLKVVAKWSRDVAAMDTRVVFYADSLPAVMPLEPGEYPFEYLIYPVGDGAKSAAHWFFLTSKTGHTLPSWEKACNDAFALIQV